MLSTLTVTSSYTYNGQTYQYPGPNFSGAGQGGAISSGSGMLNLSGVTLTANQAASGPVGPGASSGGSNALVGFSVGGGLSITGGTATISNSTFSGNTIPTSGGGGGLAISAATATISGSTLTKNSAPDGFGGALYGYDQALSIAGCVVTGNTAGRSGGGVASL